MPKWIVQTVLWWTIDKQGSDVPEGMVLIAPGSVIKEAFQGDKFFNARFDPRAPMWCSERYKEIYGDKAELSKVEGENHMITRRRDEVVRLTVSLFKNFIPSGFALLAVNGLPQLLASLMLFKNHRWAYWACLACGIILMLWIVLEWWIWGFVALSNIYFVLGLVETVAAWIMIRRSSSAQSR